MSPNNRFGIEALTILIIILAIISALVYVIVDVTSSEECITNTDGIFKIEYK